MALDALNLSDLIAEEMWTCHTGLSLVLCSILIVARHAGARHLCLCVTFHVSFPETCTTVAVLNVSFSQLTNKPDKPLHLTSISSFFL